MASKNTSEGEADQRDESGDELEAENAPSIYALKAGLERTARDVSTDPLPLAVTLEALALLESRKSDNSVEGDKALRRAVGLMMQSRKTELLIEVASKKSGHDVKADMDLIRSALDHATLMIAWHGDGEGAQRAKGMVRKLVNIAKEYKLRTGVTNGESVIGALRSLGHATRVDGRSVRLPNCKAIAEAVLRSGKAQPGYEKRVMEFERILPEVLAPYTCDDGYRPGVDLEDLARVVLKAAGVRDSNVLDAKVKMREHRLQQKLGTKAPGKRRQPRASKRKA